VVLVSIARFASPDGTGACPGIKTIADRVGRSPRQIQRHISALLAEGFLREDDRPQTFGEHPAGIRPTVYDVATDDLSRRKWAAAYVTTEGSRSGSSATGRGC
jgi:DNA-binding IclR family transcriptional regulator